METKDLIYAAVGAPITAAKTLNARVDKLRTRIEDRSGDIASRAQKQIDEWATEGRKVVSDVSDGKMVDEITSKVDFDQAREQVTKLRDQLEDMLATWRASFRPVEAAAGGAIRTAAEAVEKAGDKVEQAADRMEESAKPATAKKAPANKAPATKAANQAPASKTTAKKAPASKTTTNKAPASKTTAKKPANKSS